MKPQIKEQWLEALESGRYEKGKARLNYDNKFCCLGVLCDLFKDDLYVVTDDDGMVFYNGQFSYLPIKIQEFAEIEENHLERLMLLNDLNETFEPVVAYIKKWL
jgi:hypothetical protein